MKIDWPEIPTSRPPTVKELKLYKAWLEYFRKGKLPLEEQVKRAQLYAEELRVIRSTTFAIPFQSIQAYHEWNEPYKYCYSKSSEVPDDL